MDSAPRAVNPPPLPNSSSRYGPQIRRAIRVRSTGGRLQRVLDSEDICQTVIRRFFEAEGANTPAENPAMLLNWLLEVARNRLREQHRRDRTAKRGGGRLQEIGLAALDRLAGNNPDISTVVADRELLSWLMERMTPDQRLIAERRAGGEEWSEIARAMGTTAEALRKRYRRGLDALVEGVDGGS